MNNNCQTKPNISYTKEAKVNISLTISRSFIIKLEKDEDIEKWSSQEVIDAIKNQYPKEKIINEVENGHDWDIDEFIGY